MNTGKLTNSGLAQELIKYFYSPNLIFKNTEYQFQNLYCFLSRVQPWDNETNPPTPILSDYYIKQVHKNIFGIKRIDTSNMSPVIERIDWVSGTTYTEYSSTNESLFDLGSDGKLINKFYIRNSYDQVFKCLSNNTTVTNPNGSPSTIQPVVDFSYDKTKGYIETNDGYKWKYLYSIDSGSKLNFFDENWIPVPLFSHRANVNSTLVGSGEISVINVYNPGTNYIDDTGLNISTTITIDGDGSGATASAVISSNVVSNIIVTNTGTGYTSANVSISPNLNYSGNGAILIPQISPIGGHGFNLLSELACRTILVTCSFDSSVNDIIPSDIDYRQIGLLSNPLLDTGFTDGYAYRKTTDVLVSPGSGLYQQDEFVYQGTSLDTATFQGTVLNFDSNNNILYLINTVGTINNNSLIKGDTSKTIRVVSNSQQEQIVPFSGEIIYVENREKIQRSSSGLEQFRLTITY